MGEKEYPAWERKNILKSRTMCVEPCAQSPPLDDVCGMPVPPKVQFGCGYNTLALAATIVKSKIASGREICQQGACRVHGEARRVEAARGGALFHQHT